MKNRKGYIDRFSIGLMFAISATLMLIGFIISSARSNTNIRCVQTLQLMPTLKDSVRFYQLYPACINVTPKDTLHV